MIPEQLSQLAKFYVEHGALFFDTETTGVGEHDQVLTLSVLEVSEKLVYDRLYIPTVPIDPAAEAVHGISLEKCQAEGRKFDKNEFYNVKNLFNNRLVVAYNATYDIRLINQTLAATGLPYPNITPLAVLDAMILYSLKANVVNNYGSPRWFKLSEALSLAKVDCSDLGFHDSKDDVKGMIRLVRLLASETA